MRQVLTGPRRAAGIRLLIDSGLAAAILPELNEAAATDPKCFERTLEVVDRLDHPGFSLALAAAFWPTVNTETAGKIGERWRLTNKEIDRIAWLLDRHGALDAVQHKAWSSVQRVLVAEGAGDLLDWMQAERATDEADDADVAWCRRQLARPHEEIDPAPLLSGADLIEHGVPRGPIYRELLDQVRDAQLDGRIDSTAAALQLVDRILSEN